MISSAAKRICGFLVCAGVVSQEESELYEYGFFLLISRAVFFVLVCTLGLLCDLFWECILFYLHFSLLRGYAGGVHASKESICTFWTTFCFCLAVAGMGWLRSSGLSAIAWGMLLVFGPMVWIFSPLDVPEKPLTPSEKRRYGRISKWLVFASALIAIFAAQIGFPLLLWVIPWSVALEGMLLLAGFLKQSRSQGQQKIFRNLT